MNGLCVTLFLNEPVLHQVKWFQVLLTFIYLLAHC